MRDSIGPDGIRSKLLDLPEPAQIFLLRNGTIRGKISGLAKFEIHALDVKDLQPVARGTSGRLYKLKIVGEKLTKTIGKELTIRYALSESALYSSAFVVEKHDVDAEGYPAKFVLRGAGWGHGVGLCQIGAAVMGAKGYDYKEILLHYFIGANIEPLY